MHFICNNYRNGLEMKGTNGDRVVLRNNKARRSNYRPCRETQTRITISVPKYSELVNSKLIYHKASMKPPPTLLSNYSSPLFGALTFIKPPPPFLYKQNKRQTVLPVHFYRTNPGTNSHTVLASFRGNID